MRKEITFPLTEEAAKSLRAGEMCYARGTIYTARDAAHKRLYDAVLAGEELPFDIKNQAVYYLGPSPARPGNVIGSAGPTTSSRMDKYTPLLMEQGLIAMVGKGKRSKEVHDSIKKHGGVYFAAIGGAGALLSKCIKEASVIAYDDLGTEAIRKLYVEDLPLVVIIDSLGNDYYEICTEKQE